jgi:hypothetical protein
MKFSYFPVVVCRPINRLEWNAMEWIMINGTNTSQRERGRENERQAQTKHTKHTSHHQTPDLSHALQYHSNPSPFVLFFPNEEKTKESLLMSDSTIFIDYLFVSV